VSFEPLEDEKIIVGTITDIEDDLGRLHVKVINRVSHKKIVCYFSHRLVVP
jgi:hypothetical protein